MSDKPRFDAAFAAVPPVISEMTFTNLFSWRRAYAFAVSELEGSLVVAAASGGKKRYFLPLDGDRMRCTGLLAREGRPFIRVAEADVDAAARSSGFRAVEDRDNDDYVYVMEDLVALKGKRFDGKRNFIKKFKRQYAYEYLVLDGATSAECLDFEDIWCGAKSCDADSGLAREREAVHDMCHNFSFFGLTGGALRVEGRIVAVVIAQRLNADTMVMHVLKGMMELAGVYQVMQNEFLTREGAGYAFVNMEQDLGVEGLRKSKLSYHPARMVRKFTLEPAIPGA